MMGITREAVEGAISVASVTNTFTLLALCSQLPGLTRPCADLACVAVYGISSPPARAGHVSWGVSSVHLRTSVASIDAVRLRTGGACNVRN